MGLMKQGKALTWDETQDRAKSIKELGIEQFLKLWDSEATRCDEERKWGDEIEYILVHFDDEGKNATLAACQDELLAKLNSFLSGFSPDERLKQPHFVPEYTKFSIETSPAKPYTSALADLLLVESNMRQRREMIRMQLGPNEAPITLSNFPRLGAPGIFSCPPFPVLTNSPRDSLTVSKELIGSLDRYKKIKANMITRKGSKMFAYVPVFVDKHTASPFYDPISSFQPESCENGGSCQGRLFLDSVVFSGCCSLQVTQQSRDLSQARRLYDALLPLAPILMALSASSPASRGYLCDTDCRWKAASGCADDRTEAEYQAHLKARWDMNEMYIFQGEENRLEYNDVPIAYDQRTYERLRKHGIDELFSKHISCIFAREPVITYAEDFDKDAPDMNHFDNLASAMWRALHLKYPQGPEMGWRVEFRTMEASITDFESAAFAIFLVLFSNAVLHFDLNLYIPMSKVIKNMEVAHRRGAASTERFAFRKSIHKDQEGYTRSLSDTTYGSEEMTIDEIFNGSTSKNFPGLLIFVERYVDLQNPDEETKIELLRYINFIRDKAKGTYMTTATWIRNFVRSHLKYQFDSIISEEIGYDLITIVNRM